MFREPVMKLLGVLASVLLVSTAYVSPVLAQDDSDPDANPTAADLLTNAAIGGLDEKAADKCDCSADTGLTKYEACINKIIPGEVSAFAVKKGSANLLKFFGLKKGDINSALQDERDFLVQSCDEELNPTPDDPSDDPDSGDPDSEDPPF
jgi:hypothetical protein